MTPDELDRLVQATLGRRRPDDADARPTHIETLQLTITAQGRTIEAMKTSIEACARQIEALKMIIATGDREVAIYEGGLERIVATLQWKNTTVAPPGDTNAEPA